MKALPPDLQAFKRTPEFDAGTIPAGLRRAHTTKAGTWGLIVVTAGQLRYRILTAEIEETVLTTQRSGVVEPTVPHEVEPIGEVSFYVEFYR